MSTAARLTEVEITTPAPRADAGLLADLGFWPTRDPGAGPDASVLRTCADPYGCRVVLRPGPRAEVTRLTWRPADGDHLQRLVERLEQRRGPDAELSAVVLSSGWAGDDYRVVHPGGGESVLLWRQDRAWAVGSALSCPLHPDGSTRLCVEDPPLIVGVDVPVPAALLELWTSQVLGPAPQSPAPAARGSRGPALRAGEGPPRLRVSCDRSQDGREWATPGGWVVSAVAGEPVRSGRLESEVFF
ncbi:hypothetical protein [Kineococcus rhizosphaerae]|uniref:Uncharacterized protein n=1 Tax=Kineococcus rhizosphaerae TaxID=559628 RepID=A0A2T0R1G5_9ACTN|nr:hypothetical protein [Kineococcus rhizosphaerae]PRY13392.1 hypothetical protein CLV37_10860 [Kineococcus rhizosphaerae]